MNVLSYSLFSFNNVRFRFGSLRCFSTPSGRGSAVATFKAHSESEGNMISTSPLKGTRDFYPSDMRVRTWLEGKWKCIAHQFGFEEYDAPILENEELYLRKAGEELSEQLFCFTDKGGRRVTLRPELTPSLARMIMGKGKSLTFPLKWFSIPQCWRYEKMSRGRRREHYQWNMDVWGVSGVEAEAELIAAVISCFKTLGLTACEVGIKVNSRRLLNEIMSHAGIDEEKWSPVCVIIDKLDKQTAVDLEEDFRAVGLNAESLHLLLEMLAIKDLEDLDSALGGSSEGTKELRTLLGLLGNGYDISSDWVSYDGTVVRGLAYYTGVVFEGIDRERKLRAICGGGRYDKLFQNMGGTFALPAVGFGFGDAVILELLRDRDLIPALSDGAADVVVYPLDESLRFKAMAVAKELREASLRVDLVMEKERRMKWVLQRADRSGATAVVIIAPDEHCNNEAVVRDLLCRVQSNVAYKDMVAHVGKIIKES